MNGRLQNIHTAHDLQKQNGADRMSEMTCKKGSPGGEYTVYNTVKVNFVATVNAL
jgi:hypothetical protein